MENPDNLEAFPESKIRQRTDSGRSISRPNSSPPDPPDVSPLETSTKKQKIFNQVMNMFQSKAIETYSEALNQTKLPEVNDQIWLRPSRVSKQEMDLTGISQHSPWILVTLIKQDEEQSRDSSTWYFALDGLKKAAKVTLRPSEAWEFLSDLTCTEADQARRDRLVKDVHSHNLIPYPKITVTKEEANQAAPELGSLTPSN